jgi:Holliday junction resolvase RusA-like endonuclease
MTNLLVIEGKGSPSGSKNAYVNRYSGRVSVVDSAKNKEPWQAWVRLKAEEFAKERGIKPNAETSFHMEICFHFRRPKGHFGTGKNNMRLKESAPEHHLQKPDVTKLVRCLEDALKGIWWHDDSQVVSQYCSKEWHEERDFVEVVITEAI